MILGREVTAQEQTYWRGALNGAKGASLRFRMTDQLAATLADPAAARAQTVSAVTSAYRQVDPKCREVIKSYCVEDMTLAETADRSGYSPKTVWKRIQECLKKMRACLS